MDAQNSQSYVTRRLTALYVGALVLIGVLLIGEQALIQRDLQLQSHNAHVINIAGRQRMLSQKLAKAALAIRFAPDSDTRTMRITELQKVVTLWGRCQRGLQFGDAELDLPGSNSPQVKAMFADIEPQHQVMLDAASSLIASATLQNKSAGPDPGWSPFVQKILSQETSFLIGMDAIVTQYDSEAKQSVIHLQQTEMALLGVTLAVLVLEGLFVLRPAVRRIGQAIMELEEADERLMRQNETLEARNKELETKKGELSSLQLKLAKADAMLSQASRQVEKTATGTRG